MTTPLNGSNGFSIYGINNEDLTGAALATGDINGDGISNIIIGAPYAPNNTMKGKVYVVFGHPPTYNWPASMNLSGTTNVMNGINGFEIDDPTADDYFGTSVAAGDINGDGIQDMIIGTALATAAGKTYVVFGTQGHGLIPLIA